MVCSMSLALRTSIGLASIPRDGATDRLAPNWPIPTASVGSRRTATRFTLGAISLRSSSHFPLAPYSRKVNPVTLPPGRARLETYPAPTGSLTFTNTIGNVRVTSCTAAVAALPPVRMTSGASATISAAYLRDLAASAAPANVDLYVAAFGPTQCLQSLQERRDTRLTLRIGLCI